MSLLALLSKPGRRTLLEVVANLPAMGVGSRVTRAAWAPYGDSFWEVTKVKPRNEDGSAGKVWGVLTWRGQREERPRQINGRQKRVWRWVPSEAEAARLQPLVAEWRQLEHAVQQQQQQAAGGGSS